MILVEMQISYQNFVGSGGIKKNYAFDLYDSEKNKHSRIKLAELHQVKLSASERNAILLFMRDLVLQEKGE
jgi:hypothetical protein